MTKQDPWKVPASEVLRVGAGFELAQLDPSSTPGLDGGTGQLEKHLLAQGERMSELQERLFAEGRSGGSRSVLLVLQGMDTAGKGGIVRHVVGMVDPQGVRIRAFGVPTAEERSHHYLWRIRRELPPPGRIGVFDRSHYEDVLVVRVHHLVDGDPWEHRYEEINAFESKAADAGTTIVKCALMVSPQEQLRRLGARLERPDKYWKYKPHDLDERAHWFAYMEAYQAALTATGTDIAPWYAIPADHKAYTRAAVTSLLLGALESLDLGWPPADFDVEAERARVAALAD
jgi:PPK2 family polyphosphate:nucleotide phosphotransferase